MWALVLLCLTLPGLQAAPVVLRTSLRPNNQLSNGFRQGTEPVPVQRSTPDGFRQGTESSSRHVVDQNTGLVLDLLREMEESVDVPLQRVGASWVPKTATCRGEIMEGICYEFHRTALAFREAQERCRARSAYADLASVTSKELHSHLVSLVTKGGETELVLTWIGATIKDQHASWLDGSEWVYSDWMPGHPYVHSEGSVCVEMFNSGQSWWTEADCELQRASICSYPVPV